MPFCATAKYSSGNMSAAKSYCLSSTSVRPVDSIYDKPIDDIDCENGIHCDECGRSLCCSLEGIL